MGHRIGPCTGNREEGDGTGGRGYLVFTAINNGSSGDGLLVSILDVEGHIVQMVKYNVHFLGSSADRKVIADRVKTFFDHTVLIIARIQSESRRSVDSKRIKDLLAVVQDLHVGSFYRCAEIIIHMESYRNTDRNLKRNFDQLRFTGIKMSFYPCRITPWFKTCKDIFRC